MKMYNREHIRKRNMKGKRKKVRVRERGEENKRRGKGWGGGLSVFCFVMSCMHYTTRFFYLSGLSL